MHQPASRIPQSTRHHSRESLDRQQQQHQQQPQRQQDIQDSTVQPAGSPFQTRQSSSSNMSTLSERRLNQRNKDERIRKKIEDDLAKKRGGVPKRGYREGQQQQGTPSRGGASSRNSRAKQAGTVSALRPSPALTVPQHISVADASQLCAAKRTDCVLVVDDEEHLCGIFTAKDLAFRVVGEGLDPRNTPVQQIMTPNPMVTRDTTSATDALQTMVTRGFRHLPVCNEDGDVVGLLDITKVFQESLEKLERAYGSSQKLYAALEGVQSEWGAGGPGAAAGFGGAHGLMNYVEALREKMSFPDLGSILDDRTRAVTVSASTKVKDAAILMKKNRTTAVCVTDESGKLSGIFTSKDVVLRVIAAGLNSSSTSVVRVMTPHPDTGTPSLSIQEALRKMNDGHFLNLPVLEEDGSLAGCVDVLKLTYATLEQISAIGAEQGGADAAGGPLWGRFFSSFAAATADGDTESVVSDSQPPTSSVAPGTPSAMPKHMRHDSTYAGSPSEIHPNDSASAVGLDDDDSSEVVKPKNKKGGRSAESAIESTANAAIIHDDGTYLFKFFSPSGMTHRFVARYDSYLTIREIIAGKLASDPFFLFQVKSDGSPPPAAGEMDPSDFHINYRDDDGDLVLLHTDGDLEDSVKTARKQGRDRVLLTIKGGKGWENAIQASAEQQQAERKKALKAVQEEEDLEHARSEKASSSLGKKKGKSSSSSADDELVFGFLQKDMVLPAAIAFLGVAVIGVFALSRSSNK